MISNIYLKTNLQLKANRNISYNYKKNKFNHRYKSADILRILLYKAFVLLIGESLTLVS